MSLKCSRNERFQRCLWPGLVVLTILSCGILLCLSYHKDAIQSTCPNCRRNSAVHAKKVSQGNCEEICTTKECIFASDSTLKSIDESIDPCQDFYAFACGKWLENFRHTDNDSVVEGMTSVLRKTLRGVLDDTIGSQDTPVQKMKTVYDSCIDYSSSEANAVPTLLEFFDRIGIRGWPHLEPDFQFVNSTLEEVLAALNVYNEFAFVKFSALGFSLGSLMSLQVDPGLPSEHLVKEETVLGALRYLGLNDTNANAAWQEFQAIDNSFYDLLEDENLEKNCKTNCSSHKMMLDCSQEVDDELRPLCNISKALVEYAGIGHQFSPNNLFITEFYFVKNVFPLMANYTHRALANYLALRVLTQNMNEMNTLFRLLFVNGLDEKQQKKDKNSLHRWEHCVGWIADFMSQALALEYLETALPNQALEEVLKITNLFQREAANYTFTQEWIEENSRTILGKAIGKMTDRLRSIIPKLSNKTLVNLLYKDFHPTNESFLKNVLTFKKHGFLLNFRNPHLMERHIDPREHPGFAPKPFVVNAFHIPGTFDLPLGILLPPVFLHGRPELLNVATLGSIVGHEIGHEVAAFLFTSGLDNLTEGNLFKKAECLERKYFDYEIKKIGKNVKGNETLIENVADFMGIKVAERAIDKLQAQTDRIREPSLPALNYTVKQIFYIGFAQIFCNIRSPELELKHYEKDEHAPPEFRVTGVFQNSREFSEAFNCPEGSNMNPLKKCIFFD